ncbi:hypothetical protein AURDEDRAFT_159669 [Auricularia subglabra TFB-10046 SS5]|nr:hypothetical protein AURDEDRAFT_159669 [Auricularia subglabra TFB-10046 SS5]
MHTTVNTDKPRSYDVEFSWWDPLSLYNGHPPLNPTASDASDVSMEPPNAPRLPTVPMPVVEPLSRPGASSLRGIPGNIARRLGLLRSSTPAPAPPSVHPVLAHGLLYDATTNPGTFTTPDDQPLAAAVLDGPASLTYPQSTAALSFAGAGAAIPTNSFIRCPPGRPVIAVRDVLDAVDAALQGSRFVRQVGLVRVEVQSRSVGDFCVSFSV